MPYFSHIPTVLQNEDNAVSRMLHKIEVSPSFLELADGLESTVKVKILKTKNTFSCSIIVKTSIFKDQKLAVTDIIRRMTFSTRGCGNVDRNCNTDNTKYG
jgi:hypothetical protein